MPDDVRIKDLSSAEGGIQTDDYLPVDGSTNGTRKITVQNIMEANVSGLDTEATTPKGAINELKSRADASDTAIGELEEGISDIADMFADAYDSTKSYAVGNHCIKDDVLYVCNTAIPSGGETWNSAHWTATTYDAEVSQLKSNLTELGTAQSKIFKNAQTIIINLKNAPSGDNVAQALMFNANQGMCAIVRMDSNLSVTNILGSMGWTISNSGSTITITPSSRLWGATSVIVDEIN